MITFENRFLVLEYAPNGDLYEFLLKKGILNSEEAFVVFNQIIEGIDHCHKHLIWYENSEK